MMIIDNSTMNFIDNIKELLGIESYEQKLYKQLHTEPYTRKGFRR